MTLIKHWAWLIVMVLGLICVTVGVFFIVGGEEAKSEAVDGFDLTRVKYYDFSDPNNITWEYKDVNSAEDIEDILANIKEQRYFMEDLQGYMLGELEAGESYTSENKKSDDVKYDLYFAFIGGEEAKDAGNPFVGYIPTIDGQLAFGEGKIVLGMAKLMQYTGISIILVGIALIMVAVILLGFTQGFGKLGGAVSSLKRGQPQS